MTDLYSGLLDSVDKTMKRRVWLDPRDGLFCFTADRVRMSVADAEALDYFVASATPDPDSSRHCLTDAGEYVSIASAKAWGYKIGEAKKLPGMPRKRPEQASTPNSLADEALSPEVQARLDRRIGIYSLDEARERPSAAAALANSPDITTIEEARSLLRGLPLETDTKEDHSMSNDIDPAALVKLNRKVELHIAALNHNANAGNDIARRKAKKLSAALSLHKQSGVSLGIALGVVGADRALVDEVTAVMTR